MINLQNITKIYDTGAQKFQALCGISMTIKSGEFVAIMGPSGSGKSTLMNILGCLDTATTGEYLFEVTKISQYSEDQLAKIRNQKIGFVFQSFNLLPKLTAFENVELPLIYRGIKTRERQERAMAVLEQVGLGDRVNHKPSELSGGQQQRAAIARAVVGDPTLILADEPTGALDSKSGREVLEILRDLNQQGRAIILITHDVTVAENAQKIIFLRDGLIKEERVI